MAFKQTFALKEEEEKNIQALNTLGFEALLSSLVYLTSPEGEEKQTLGLLLLFIHTSAPLGLSSDWITPEYYLFPILQQRREASEGLSYHTALLT